MEIPVQMVKGEKGALRESNIFVQHNIGSKFILLNRPAALNALNINMIHDLHKAYKEAEHDEHCGLFVLYGAGEKAFCAGGDVAVLGKTGPVPLGQHAPQMDFFRAEYTLNHHIGSLQNQLQVAMLRGYVMGGGAGLSMHGPVRIATEDSLFSMPETALGLFPDVGASHFLTKLTKAWPGLAMYLALTGRRLNGAEMYGCGLASHWIDMGQIPGMFERLLTIYEYTPQVLESILGEFTEKPPTEDDHLSRQQEAVARCFTHDSLDAVREALKAEAGGAGEHAKFAGQAVRAMEKASPTSLMVTFELMRRATAAAASKKFTLGQALQIDYRVARRFVAGGDFFEGVRAVLIDKDLSPKWRPAPSPAEVAEYFEPMPKGEKELVLH